MIIKFLCWFWGHDIVFKEYHKDQGLIIRTYTLQARDLCARCGKKNEFN